MVERDELRTEAVASVAITENPRNYSLRAREEGELSCSSDNDGTTASQEEPVPVASISKSAKGDKAGRCISISNLKNIVEIPSRTSAQRNYQKGTEKNRAPFVPFVISFSDDDSGSESEELRQSKASGTKDFALGADGNRRLPASSVPKSQVQRQTTKNEGRYQPRKVPLNRTFVSSMTKINGANTKNGGRSLVEQRSRFRNFSTLNKKLDGRKQGNNNTHLNSSKLQDLRQQIAIREKEDLRQQIAIREKEDLRQQIAIREKELKSKSAQKNKETVSGSSREYNITVSENDASKKRRVASAVFVPFEQGDPDKKRLKLSEPHPSQLISDVSQQMSLVQSEVQTEKYVLENGCQQSNNAYSHRDKHTALVTMHTGAAQQKTQVDTRGPLSSGNRSTGVKDGAGIIINGSQCHQNTKLMDHSMSLEQTEKIVKSTAKTSSKKSKAVNLTHSGGLNCHQTLISDKATRGHSLTVGELHEVRSGEKAFKPASKNEHQPCSLHVRASNLETSDVSLHNTGLCNCLGKVSISRDNMDMQSLLDIEELQDKELEEAQEHRRKCEIEERNALKAYRNAQRALVEANARCSYLYRRRELYSAQFRSLMMENSSLFCSSSQFNCTGAGMNSSNSMSEDHMHQLPTSNHQMQAEFNDYNEHYHHSNIKAANGPLQIVSDQHVDGQHFDSDACSEPDSGTSEPHKYDRMADGVCSSSSDLNESADEDEDGDEDEETFPFDHESIHSGLDSQGKEERNGQRTKEINVEAEKKLPCDSSQDSLLLEATLRSKLVASLGTKTLSKKRGPTPNTEPAVVTGVVHGGAAEQVEMNAGNVPVPVVEKNQHSAFGGTDCEEKVISELPVETNDSNVKNFSSNYASPTADLLDSCLSTKGNKSSRSVTYISPVLRSAFGQLKVTKPISLVGRIQQIGNYDICNEESYSVRSTEIRPSILNSNLMDKTLTDICAGKVGCYTCDLAIDPFWPLCMFELRGKCNNDECSSQHVKDYSGRSMHLEKSVNSDCQVGSSTHRGNFYGAPNTSKGNDYLDLAPPAYLVCLDLLKGDLHPCGSALARSVGQCWQKCFSSSLVLSSLLLPPDSPTDEPFLHGTQARIVHGSWNSQSLYFHSRNGTKNQLDHHFADNDQSLEMALLNLNQEVDKRKGRTEALKVLARAVEVNPSSVVLWVVYLHIYYGSEKSIGKDDMFLLAVEQNEGSYELWLLYINSRVQLEDRVVAYDTALLALCRHASAPDSEAVHASACILDLFLQLVNCLCISGNAGEAIEKIYGLLSCTQNSDESRPQLLSIVLPCLTLYDKCIFWLSCLYFTLYKKLPDVVVRRFECEKELSEMAWPSKCLTVEEKQQAITVSEMAVDSLALYMDTQSLESESTLKAAHMFAVNHIRCIAVLEGLECSRTLLDKYSKLYPSCLELVLMSGRMSEDDYGDANFVGFEEALINWPEEVPGVQCIWNQYAEFALQNGRFDFVKELMNRWFHSVWQVHDSRCGIDSMQGESTIGSLDLAPSLNLDSWISSSSEEDVVFGLLNLSLHKLLQNDLIEARLAIDRALKAASAEDYKYCVKEHALFLLANGSQLKEETRTGDILNMLKCYLIDARAFPTSQPLSRKFIQSIKKPRVRQLVSNIWSCVSLDLSLVNLVLEAWHGPSLLPESFCKLKDVVDFVEGVMEILPSNYQLAMSVCRLLSKHSEFADMTSASVSFWASSLLVNALFQAVPVAAEYVWVEAAAVLQNLTDIQSISESFHKRALTVYPFSVNLWKSYLNLSKHQTGNMSNVIEAARERGIKLELTL